MKQKDKGIIAKAKSAWKAGVKAFQDPEGRQMLDPTPAEMPVGFEKPESVYSKMRRMIQMEISNAAKDNGAESFEESNDFDTGEEDRGEYANDAANLAEMASEHIGKDGTLIEEKPVRGNGEGEDNAGAEKSVPAEKDEAEDAEGQ